MTIVFANRLLCWLGVVAVAAVPGSAIGQSPRNDLKNMTIGELLGRDVTNASLEPDVELPPADAQCAQFPFRDNGADVSAFTILQPATTATAEEHRWLIEDYEELLNVRGQASMFAKPDVAIESSLEVVSATQTTFGILSRQFGEAAGFHAEMLLTNSNYDASRSHIAAAVYSGCRNLGADHFKTIAQLDTLAYVTGLAGDTLISARLLNDLADRIQQLKGIDHSDTIAVRERYALALADLNRGDDAEVLLRSTLALARSSFAPDDLGLINSINNYAFMLGTNGKLEDAIPLHAEVVEKNEKHFEAGHPRQIAGIGNFAIALLKAGQIEAAKPLISEQIRLVFSSRQKSDYEIAVALLNRADLAVAEERFDEAEQDQKLAVEIYAKIYGQDHPVARRALQKLWRTLLRQEDASALAIAETAVTRANVRRNALGFNIGSTLQSERNLASESEVQTLYLDSLWIAGKRDPQNVHSKAFPAMQHALQSPANKAFGAAAARRTATERSSRLGTLVAQRETLSRQWELAELERVMLLSGGATAASEQLTERTSLQQKLAVTMDAVDEQLWNEAPDFFELLRPEPVAATKAIKSLGSNEAVLLLQPGAFGTHAMLVTASGLHWHRSDWARDRMDATVQRLLYDAGFSVEVQNDTWDRWEKDGRGYLSFDRKLAHALYMELIAPFSDELKGVKQIFVAAGGSLSSLPLAILVSEQPVGGDDSSAAGLRQTHWLIDDFALATIPSLQSLIQSRGRQTSSVTPDRKKFLGFGDPLLEGRGVRRSVQPGRRNSSGLQLRNVFSIDPESGNASVQLDRVRKLSRLPGTAGELKKLSALLGGNEQALYLADRATEPAFRSADLNSEIVVLATHGLVAGELDFLTEPALVLTPPASILPDDDGLLTASEITRLRIDAEWVVLSACNTAASDGRDGAPGLSGLAQAFFYAGTKNLLVSHWPVRDDVAARITVRAIELEQAGEVRSRADALRQAVQELKADTSLDRSDDHLAHPNAWAPFILVGDSR
ncbi:MAG: CHAT domain-containing tetratricopeptide repeat protein [Parasphingorhabdus sp.]